MKEDDAMELLVRLVYLRDRLTHGFSTKSQTIAAIQGLINYINERR